MNLITSALFFLVGGLAVFYMIFSIGAGGRKKREVKQTSLPEIESQHLNSLDRLTARTRIARTELTEEEAARLLDSRIGLTAAEFQVKRVSQSAMVSVAGLLGGYVLGNGFVGFPLPVTLALAGAMALMGWRWSYQRYANQSLLGRSNKRREEMVKHFYELSDATGMFLSSYPPRDAIIKSLPYISNPELSAAVGELVTDLTTSNVTFEDAILSFQENCVPSNKGATYSGEYVKSWCSRMIQSAQTGHDIQPDMETISRGVRAKRYEARERRAESAGGIAVVSIMIGFIVGVVPIVVWCTVGYDGSSSGVLG